MPKAKSKRALDPGAALTGHASGQSRLQFPAQHIIYSQGGKADALFYIESGLVKISVVVPSGKEAVVGIRRERDLFGTRCLVGQRMGTATALTATSLIRVTTSAVTRLLREEPDFAVNFAIHLLHQSIYDQENLVDQLTNSAERRLARTLLQLADFSNHDVSPIPAQINQTLLAEMVGTTRSRINFFMNKFKRQALIEYDRHGGISVRNSLLDLLT